MIKNFETIASMPIIRSLLKMSEQKNPNMISYFGALCALGAGISIYYKIYIITIFCLIAHLLSDGLDGYIARKMNKTSSLGFITDHILDRTSDIVIFYIIGLSVANFQLAVITLILTLFSSYIGVLGRIFSIEQDKSGLYRKAYRYQLLIITFILMSIFTEYREVLINVYLIISIIAASLTIIPRIISLRRNVINN